MVLFKKSEYSNIQLKVPKKWTKFKTIKTVLIKIILIFRNSIRLSKHITSYQTTFKMHLPNKMTTWERSGSSDAESSIRPSKQMQSAIDKCQIKMHSNVISIKSVVKAYDLINCTDIANISKLLITLLIEAL